MAHKKPENLRDLLITKMQVLHFTENELIKAIPKMAEAASDKDLRTAFLDHHKETEKQVQRLTQAFDLMDVKPEMVESDAATGLIADAQWSIDNIENPQTLDASLISAAQFVEHFEMAGYGSAAAWAELLGEIEVKNLLTETLEEEKMADEKLNALAIVKVNEQATDEQTGEVGILGRMEAKGI